MSSPAEDGVAEEQDEQGISYSTAANYWDGVAPTVEGMLGGFGKISPIGRLGKHCS